MLADQHLDPCEHAALQRPVLIRQVDLDGHRPGRPIQCLNDAGDGAFKNPIGIGLGPDLGLLPDLHERDVLFHDFDESPHRLDVVEAEDAAGRGRRTIRRTGDVGTEIEIALRHITGEGRPDIRISQVRFGLCLCHFHLFHLGLQGFQGGDGTVRIDLGVVEILL